MARKIPDLDPRTNLEMYTRAALKNADVWTPERIQSEYSRLRSIARKRLERLSVAEPESYAYRHNVGRYKPVKEMTTPEMRKELENLAKFITAKTGTVRGIREKREKAVSTLQSHGYKGISGKNIRQFGKFMGEWRDASATKSVGSPSAVELFEFLAENDIPWEEIKGKFDRWVQHRKKLESWIERREDRGEDVTSDDILARFDELEQQRTRRNARARERRKRGASM